MQNIHSIRHGLGQLLSQANISLDSQYNTVYSYRDEVWDNDLTMGFMLIEKMIRQISYYFVEVGPRHYALRRTPSDFAPSPVIGPLIGWTSRKKMIDQFSTK